MSMMKKISMGICLAAVCSIILSGCGASRNRDDAMEKVTDAIQSYRESASSLKSISLDLSNDVKNDEKFKGFLVEQIADICLNDEFELLGNFLRTLEREDIQDDDIQAVVTDGFEATENTEAVLDSYEIFNGLVYYKRPEFTKDSPLILEFLSENSYEVTTADKSEGYYANKESESTHKRVGIEGSALHDDTSMVYYGDFAVYTESGVDLDRSSYTEEKYSRDKYYFRGEELSFNPIKGFCLLSGDYLMHFNSSGILENVAKVDLESIETGQEEELEERYQEALEAFNSGNDEQAMNLFAGLGDYKDSEQKAEIAEVFVHLKKSDEKYFEQNKNEYEELNDDSMRDLLVGDKWKAYRMGSKSVNEYEFEESGTYLTDGEYAEPAHGGMYWRINDGFYFAYKEEDEKGTFHFRIRRILDDNGEGIYAFFYDDDQAITGGKLAFIAIRE